MKFLFGIAAALLVIAFLYSPEKNSVAVPPPTSKTVVNAPQAAFITAATTSTVPANSFPAKVSRVVDGDTFKVIINGKEETVRMLLIDTPETVKPNTPVQPFGKEASNFTKAMLTGKTVQLERDISDARDKYGRLLYYVYVNGKSVQEALLENGLARVAYVYPPNVKYVDQYRAIQSRAQKEGIGIWSVENYVQADGFHPSNTSSTASHHTPTSTSQVVHNSAPASNVAEAGNVSSNDDGVYYKNCTEARKAGAAPIYRGQPGYRPALDRDNDGCACE
ncbi:thermonuclease family protein [Aneurinibacillus terranovensis]|uniref:thermonuclease family protein n=1 Tax=Aneurinibacillus terranovensis TaxID=278991 RepID=UPI000428CC76|nr:thermonuclease family protein [Aneurinibacillus terranovensis]